MERDIQTYRVIGAAMAVHRELGCGFLEAVYQDALKVEFNSLGIPFLCEVALPIHYREQLLTTTYRADFICYGSLIVELKATAKLTTHDEAQLLNYLKATRIKIGLLLNFGARSLEQKRMILTEKSV
ncbi:MAG: GxxExxY protein [Gallionella sp.]